MKKLLSSLLLLVLLAQILPFDALATVGKVLTADELARAYALTGLGDGDGLYHNGMKPNASWNAAQLIDYLEERLSTDIYNLGDTISRAGYALAGMEKSKPAAHREFMKSGANESLEQLRVEAEALRQEMRYYKIHLEEASGLIAELSHAMQDDGDSMFDSDKVRYSARIEEAVRNLTADRQTVVDNIDAWEAKAEQLRKYLQEGPYGSDEDDLYIGDLLGELFKAEAPVHNTAKVTAVTASNTRLSRLAADAGLASNDVDFSIDVMSEHQVGISLCRMENKKRVPVTDVKVSVKDILNSSAKWIDGKIDNLGNAMFESNIFTTDEYDCVRLALKIDGGNKYKSIQIDDLDLDLGVPYEIVMETLGASANGAGETANAAGEPYLVSAEFNGKDILYSNYDMLYSPINDYDFEIKVVAANILGSPTMTMTWYENDGSFSKLKKCTATAKPQAGNVYIFKGPWKQRFSPNANDDAHRPTFSFDGGNAMKKTSRLISNRGAADQPINEGTGAGGGVFGKVMGQGMGFSTDIPLGGDHKIHLGLNLPFTEYLPKVNISPSGSITIWIGTDVFGDLVKDVTKDWKSKDLKVLRRAEEKLEKTTTLNDYKAKLALNYNYTKVRKLKFIAEGKINFGIFAVARGCWNLSSDNPDVKETLITLNVGGGFLMNCEYSWGWQFLVGPVPVNVTFSLGVSVGFGVELQLQLCWVNDEFQNWQPLILKEIDVNIGLYFGAQLGVGIKGFLEAYVKFAANLNILVRLSIQDKQPTSLTVTWGCALTVGATVFFMDFNYTWSFLHGQLYPEVKVDMLEHFMNADATAPQPEEATHQDPQDYSKLAPEAKTLLDNIKGAKGDVQILKVGNWAYAFYLSQVNGPDNKPHWRVTWNCSGGKTENIQQALDSVLNRYSTWDDCGFAVATSENFVLLLAITTKGYDKNGYPTPQDYYAILLDQDNETGHLTNNILRGQYGGVYDHWQVSNKVPLWTAMNPSLQYMKVNWTDANKRRVSNVDFYGTIDFTAYKNGPINLGKGWVYNHGKNRVFIEDSITIQNSMGDTYERIKTQTTMNGTKRITELDIGYGCSFPFVALSAPKNDKAGERTIEYFDWDMNGHGLGTRHLKAIALAKGDIRDFQAVTSQVDGHSVTTVFYIESEADADGAEQFRLKGLYIAPIRTTASDNRSREVALDVTRYDYDVTMRTESFHVGYIGVTPYLYWWNAVPKGDNTDDIVWHVWAMAYDPISNTLSDASVFAQFELPKAHIQTGTRIEHVPTYDAIRGNATTKVEAPVYEDVDMIPINITLDASGTGYLTAVAEKVAVGESKPRVSMYSFEEKLKVAASLTTAIPQHTLVKAGSFEDVDVGVMNEGNVVLAAFDIEMREVEENGVEGALAQTIHVNCYEPEKSKITMAGDINPILTGKEAAHRAEDFDFSPRQRDFIHKEETVTYSMKLDDSFTLTGSEVTGSDTKHLTSELLMPGSLADIMASFKIPDNWSGQKKLRLRIVNASVESNWLRAMANAAGLAANADDGNGSVRLEYVLDRERNVMVLQRPAVSNAAVDNAIETGIFANEVEAGDPVDLMVHVQDIDVDHRVYAGWDGQDWLSFSVKNHAVTGDQLKLTCAVYVDDAEEPYYLNLPYYRQATSTRHTQTFRAPLSALVDDVNRHKQLRVVISAVGIEESAQVNNEFTVNLGGADPLRFTRQPEDVVAQEGEDVAFTVEVAGGTKPYTYQWQVWDPVHEKWVDLKGFTDPTLSRKDIEKKWDGCRFRCVVTDAQGTQIVSREVTLRVRDRVDTGDNSNLPLYLAAAMAAIALLWWMRRRRREA